MTRELGLDGADLVVVGEDAMTSARDLAMLEGSSANPVAMAASC